MIDTTSRPTGSSSTLGYIFTRSVFRCNCLLALVVGCLRTLTNQLDVLLSQPFTALLGLKIVFNFLIPFAVSSTSAVLNRRSH